MRTLALLLAFAVSASGQAIPIPAPAAPPPPPEPVDTLGRTTPNGTVLGFLKAASAHDYARASQYLNTRLKNSEAQEIAAKLHGVMDQGFHGSVARISREPEGDLSDGLAPNQEKIGAVEFAPGKFDIELERVKQKDGTQIWLFSSKTLRDVPEAFASTQPPVLFDRLPPALRDTEFLGISLWRWILGAALVSLAFVLASLLARGLVALTRVTFHNPRQSSWRPEGLTGPLRIVLISVSLYVLSHFSMTLLARSAWAGAAVALAIIGFAWLAIRLGGIAYDIKAEHLMRQQRSGSVTVLAMARRLFNVVVCVIAVILLLERSGVNVTALFAGLGLGGIAVALAARKTIENMFGGISLISREAMRVGDMCQIDGQMGLVEDIGLGTTRLRTLDRTVVSMANAQLAQLNVENFSMRDKFWLHQVVELRPGTTYKQMADIVTSANALLKKQPKVEPSSARVRFVGFNPTSLKFEVFAYILDASYESYLETQERILLELLNAIEASGTSIASRNEPPIRLENDLEKFVKSSI